MGFSLITSPNRGRTDFFGISTAIRCCCASLIKLFTRCSNSCDFNKSAKSRMFLDENARDWTWSRSEWGTSYIGIRNKATSTVSELLKSFWKACCVLGFCGFKYPKLEGKGVLPTIPNPLESGCFRISQSFSALFHLKTFYMVCTVALCQLLV